MSEQLNKAQADHEEIIQQLQEASAHCEGGDSYNSGLMRKAARYIKTITAPPSIPETSVAVERELLKHCIAELEDWAMSFPDAESMKTYEVSAALRAILSSKGDV